MNGVVVIVVRFADVVEDVVVVVARIRQSWGVHFRIPKQNTQSYKCHGLHVIFSFESCTNAHNESLWSAFKVGRRPRES